MKIKSLLFAVFMLVAALSQAQLSISVSGITQPTCPNNCNASAVSLVTGGLPPYSLHWSSGETTTTASALCAGVNQYVYVQDANGDYANVNFTVVPPAATFTVTVTPTETMPVCQYTNVHLTASGADSYEWYYEGSGYTTNSIISQAFTNGAQVTVF